MGSEDPRAGVPDAIAAVIDAIMQGLDDTPSEPPDVFKLRAGLARLEDGDEPLWKQYAQGLRPVVDLIERERYLEASEAEGQVSRAIGAGYLSIADELILGDRPPEG